MSLIEYIVSYTIKNIIPIYFLYVIVFFFKELYVVVKTIIMIFCNETYEINILISENEYY